MIQWTFTRKLAFRFLAIYCGMYLPYTWLRFGTVPVLNQITRFIWPLWKTFVIFFNDHLFHVREILVDPNGSTDTSFSWASQFTMILIAVVGAGVWSAIDRKRPNYIVAEYWLRVSVRYFVAYFALYYGIIKLFALQMPFPSLSQLSTPLGDLSQIRLAWLFMGASPTYQIFSGFLETLAGLLLLSRRTTTLGSILSVAVFANVVALNFAYDVPVKIMSSHFLVFSIYLSLFESRRLIDFFFSDKEIAPNNLYVAPFNKWGRIVAKLLFIYLSIGVSIIISVRAYKSQRLVVNTKPIEQGIYDVKHFSLDRDSLSNRWNDFVIYGVTGSIKTTDTTFVQRYERGYFSFKVDSVSKMFLVKREYSDSSYIMSLRYEIPKANTVLLRGIFHNDSLFVELVRSKKKFRLSEPEFHWLQEWSQ